jgi:hypothetical protein
VPLSYKVVDKMRLSQDKTMLHVNPSLTLGAFRQRRSNAASATAVRWNG